MDVHSSTVYIKTYIDIVESGTCLFQLVWDCSNATNYYTYEEVLGQLEKSMWSSYPTELLSISMTRLPWVNLESSKPRFVSMAQPQTCTVTRPWEQRQKRTA